MMRIAGEDHGRGVPRGFEWERMMMVVIVLVWFRRVFGGFRGLYPFVALLAWLESCGGGAAILIGLLNGRTSAI